MQEELPACPVETTLLLIGEKWKVLILRELITGTKRFGELKKAIPAISQKMLTQQLRAMEDDNLIIRTVYPEVPPRVEYSLTETGYSLKIVLDAMGAWGEQYKELHAVALKK
jgi:DNA-binding HxlR family transcriptional regulator